MNTLILPNTATRAASLRSKGRASHGEPIDWLAVEQDYRAGRLSLRQMSLKHDCSHSSIANHAGAHGWLRNSSPSASIGEEILEARHRL